MILYKEAGAGPDLSCRMIDRILDTSFTVLVVLGLKSHSLDTLLKVKFKFETFKIVILTPTVQINCVLIYQNKIKKRDKVAAKTWATLSVGVSEISSESARNEFLLEHLTDD